jgi:GNAT superfamily N-acetyltransferase
VRRPYFPEIRGAELHEASALARMSRELIEVGLGWRYTPVRMASLISDPQALVLVACQGADIAGFAVMRFECAHAHLVLLCVQRRFQKRGIGHCLCEWLIELARIAGFLSIRLELRADNAGALYLYRKLGFIERLLWWPDRGAPYDAAAAVIPCAFFSIRSAPLLVKGRPASPDIELARRLLASPGGLLRNVQVVRHAVRSASGANARTKSSTRARYQRDLYRCAPRDEGGGARTTDQTQVVNARLFVR